MEVFRYRRIFAIITLLFNQVYNEEDHKPTTEHDMSTCPFTKIIEDIFKVNTTNSGAYVKDGERTKLFLNTIANFTSNSNPNTNSQEDLVNKIIDSINQIKNNITSDINNEETNLNEAIILNTPKESEKSMSDSKKVPNDSFKSLINIKSGIEEKVDTKKVVNATKKDKLPDTAKITSTTEKVNYVEILTIEPNNTSATNTTSHNIIDVLKQLMPMFNSTLTKELHNITIIERNHLKNHSFTATKNVSTIVVTYCDKENLTRTNISTSADNAKETDLKVNDSEYDYYTNDDNDDGLTYDDDKPDANLTRSEKKDILEAAEYGMQKMHELYSILEPKLYSMGLWLDDTNPARYVAAFNAPTEDAARFYRYGYASLQAATRLKQLNSGGSEDGLQGRTEEEQFPGASALRQSPLLQHCPNKGAPKCPPASKRYRTHDGTCNNLNRPRWGSTMTPVQRFLPPSYSDGLQAPRISVFGSKLPSSREISASVHGSENVESPSVTHLLMQWGQFLDHDITSSSQSRGFNGSVPRCCKDGGRDFMPKELMHPECFPIAVPASDPFYGPRGVRCLDFVRSSPAPRDDCALGWREQLNQVSAYIDGSPLYASSARQSDKLRLFRNGMLQYGRVQQRRPLLPPERRDELCRGGAVSTDCFKSGDARVNEHPGLVAAHIVWLRQHNRMAQELAHLNPHWSDEKIYQETRKIVGSMIQHITYREFLPIVLGSEVMQLFELEPQKKGYYKAYNPKVNPSPASSFGSAAFRFGHSLVQPSMVRFDRFHRPINNNVSLHNELTNPSNIWSMGAVDRLLFGMVNQPIQKRDEFITEELTNHLFQTSQFDFGMDLAAINIQRGRDHGVPPYTSWREPCGLSEIAGFDDLFRIMPARAARRLKTLYRHVDDIDLFTGGMAERPVIGGLVGPTFACIIAQQFSNLRKGDRFWYENGGFDSSFTPAQLQQIRRISFAQVLCRTLDTIDSIQPFVFLSHDNPDNERISCHNGLLNNFDLSPWVEINSESNNDISKSDDIKTSSQRPTTQRPTTQRPRRTKPTTARPPTTKKPQTASVSNKLTHKRPTSTANNSTKPHNSTKLPTSDKIDHTDSTIKDKDTLTLTFSVDKTSTDNDRLDDKLDFKKLDDKLDFKNKTRRLEDTLTLNSRQNNNRPEKTYDYDYEDEEETLHQVQSVVVNNRPHKRPSYNQHQQRPVITVTENVNKYTYLINYVPRATESWRQTTRRPHIRDRNTDRDVVKVTYQTYDDTYRRPDDTYRRPNKPYYYNNRDKNQDLDNDFYRRNRPEAQTNRETPQSSARANDDIVLTTTKTVTTDRPKNYERISTTTDGLHKLVTFGYVGTYRGDEPTKDELTHRPQTDSKNSVISKDFSTYETKRHDSNEEQSNDMKLSTFFLYETATRPYTNLHRPTRRHDEGQDLTNNDKYYYIRNVLHKYSDSDAATTEKTVEIKKDILRENYNSPGLPVNVDVEERSSPNKMALMAELESKAAPGRKKTKPADAKTPSVAFQIIPSENSPSQWAVYEEDADLPEDLHHRMPSIKGDPHALKEIPRPLSLGVLRRRHPGKV